jgi:hypothetical protein
MQMRMRVFIGRVWRLLGAAGDLSLRVPET